MPATNELELEELAGHKCEVCRTNYATHIYGYTKICCYCHLKTKDDNGVPMNNKQALEKHIKTLESTAERISLELQRIENSEMS